MSDISDTELIDWMRDILPTIDEYGTMVKSDLDRLIALARKGAAQPVMADGCGCKMAWKQGFCYGDPEYYPPAISQTEPKPLVIAQTKKPHRVGTRQGSRQG